MKNDDQLIRGPESRLKQAQRVEAVGALSGGLAHEFNNLLGGILGYASMLRETHREDPIVSRAAEMIERAAERGAQLTKQLLGFARRGKPESRPVDIHQAAREVIARLGKDLAEGIDIREDFRAEPATVSGDEAQIRQVILNLAANACEAMPGGGRMGLESETVSVESGDGAKFPLLAPGPYVLLTINDSGIGIPKEIQHRVFEPFFTTKRSERNAGMGLAEAHEIALAHGGAIYLYSEPGQGSVVRVYLPLAAEAARPAPAADRAGGPVRGKGKVLVVDDEEVVRAMATDMLETLGYNPVTACDGREAVEFYQNCWNEIDLVILDMVMPRMGGKDCFRIMKELNPGIRAVLSTGYARDGEAQEILNEGMRGFIQKPYLMRDFSEVVAEALGGAADPLGVG